MTDRLLKKGVCRVVSLNEIHEDLPNMEQISNRNFDTTLILQIPSELEQVNVGFSDVTY